MSFDFAAVINATPYLLQGLVFSIELTLVAMIGGMLLGTFMAIIRHMAVPVAAEAIRAYVTLMRSIPLILVLFWFFFLVPLLLGHLTPAGRSIPLGPKFTALITFTLFESAYYAEIVRAGLKAVDKGQYEGAKALGLSTLTMYWSVVVPQVLQVTAPIIVSQTIILFQDTALVYVLSLTDFFGAAAKIAQRDSKLVEFYSTVAVVYLLICSIGSELSERFRKKQGYRSTRGRLERAKRMFGLARP
jgi:glutamate/aspartate transport system permease protein